MHIRRKSIAVDSGCFVCFLLQFDIREMQQYGDTLIAVAADSIRRMPLSITMFENKKILKERLGAIMEHKKHSKRAVTVASVILVTVVCAILGFSTLHGIEDVYRYESDDSLAQAQKYIYILKRVNWQKFYVIMIKRILLWYMCF